VRKNPRLGVSIFKNCKRRGEWVELVFAVRVTGLGLALGRPWGDSLAYDFTVDSGWRIVRVQVKSTIYPEGSGYSCTLKDGRGPYKKNSFDFVAAYVIPEDVWYILPEKVVRAMWNINLNPKLKGAKYNAYKEAWHLLSGETQGFVARIEACAEEGGAVVNP
jgi:hypothetical protein